MLLERVLEDASYIPLGCTVHASHGSRAGDEPVFLRRI